MVDLDGAMERASGVLAHTDAIEDFENFYVAIDNHVPEMDSSANMVAVEKSTGDCCNFVSVIPELGGMLHAYAVDADGPLVERPLSEFYDDEQGSHGTRCHGTSA